MATKKIEVIDPAIVERKTLMDNLVEDIKSLDAEREELKAIYEAKALALLEKYQDADLLRSTRREHLEEQLRGLFEQVPQAETKTQRKVALLSGDVVVKKASKTFTYEKDKLLEWAKENNYTDYIDSKVVESFKWAEFKKKLAVQEGFESDGIVVIDTGEMLVIDGLSVVEEREKMVIK